MNLGTFLGPITLLGMKLLRLTYEYTGVIPGQINNVMKKQAHSQIFLKLGMHIPYVKLLLKRTTKGRSCMASFSEIQTLKQNLDAIIKAVNVI